MLLSLLTGPGSWIYCQHHVKHEGWPLLVQALLTAEVATLGPDLTAEENRLRNLARAAWEKVSPTALQADPQPATLSTISDAQLCIAAVTEQQPPAEHESGRLPDMVRA